MNAVQKNLSEKQKKHLRGLAHGLEPLSRLGTAGVTEAFMTELEAVLERHELIKLKVGAGDRVARDAALERVIARTGASLITRVGNVAVLSRACSSGARLVLPDA